jgi:aryl-alcohol dehydrogenase-like predicted oxidoreductase
LWTGTLPAALKRSLERLRLERLDLYQIHFPLPPRSVEAWSKALGEVYQQGLTRAVGVSNFSLNQMRRSHSVLSRMGVPLASNQVEYSLLQRGPEKSGLLAVCLELNITLLAYSPLAKGLLTGKYTPQNPPPGLRGRQVSRAQLARIQDLVQLMREIGREHDSRSPAQVALNWTICKGTVPIPGAKNAAQAYENAGAMGWRLSEAEIQALDRLADEVSG